MADRPLPSDERRPGAEAHSFRWQAFVQHSRDALFLLNQHRRLLTVNPRWEEATEFTLAEVRGLVCRRRSGAEPGALEVLAAALTPPPEVLEGRPARVRRRVTGLKKDLLWWDLDFLPVRDGRGRQRIIGKLTPVSVEVAPRSPALPDKLTALRERLDQRYGFDTLASELPAMRRVADQARLAAEVRTPILIVGEPGAGKQWVARVIHHQGTHRERHFAAVGCAGIPAEVIEETLFGPAGLLQQTGLGTLLLRDVVHLPRDLQARLCDRLDAMSTTGPRVLASSSEDVTEAVRGQRLLERLHLALGTLTIAVPPLRDRRGDLPALCVVALARLNARGGSRVEGLTASVAELFQRHGWPGNLRELWSVLAEARQRAAGPLIDLADLPQGLRLRRAVADEAGADSPHALPLAKLLEEVERRLLLLALRQSHGNKSKAAQRLDIWRVHLIRRMERLGIAGPPS